MDTLIARARRDSGQLLTILYNKRTEPGFSDVNVNQYQHISSCISNTAEHNTVRSQLHRFTAMLTSPNELPRRVGHMLFKNGTAGLAALSDD